MKLLKLFKLIILFLVCFFIWIFLKKKDLKIQDNIKELDFKNKSDWEDLMEGFEENEKSKKDKNKNK